MSMTTLNTESLYEAIERRLFDEHRSWRSLAIEIGIAPSTFTRMKEGKKPSVDAFLAMLCWLGEFHYKFTLGAPIKEPKRNKFGYTDLHQIGPESFSMKPFPVVTAENRDVWDSIRKQAP
jgi:hypothetical protein